MPRHSFAASQALYDRMKRLAEEESQRRGIEVSVSALIREAIVARYDPDATLPLEGMPEDASLLRRAALVSLFLLTVALVLLAFWML